MVRGEVSPQEWDSLVEAGMLVSTFSALVEF